MQFIDLTPSWAAVLPALLAVIQDGTPEGQRLAVTELQRMSEAADRFNELAQPSTEPQT
jgi:hypothetical protein